MPQNLNDIFEQMIYTGQFKQEEPKQKKKARKTMWRTIIYQGSDLILDHAQADFGKVLKFTLQSLTELASKGCPDFRIEMADKEGNVYFYAIGPETQLINFRKRTVDE